MNEIIISPHGLGFQSWHFFFLQASTLGENILSTFHTYFLHITGLLSIPSSCKSVEGKANK